MENSHEKPRFKKLQTTPSTLKDCDEISLGTICQITHPSFIYIQLFDVFLIFQKYWYTYFFFQIYRFISTYSHIYSCKDI